MQMKPKDVKDLAVEMRGRVLEHCKNGSCCSEAMVVTLLDFFPTNKETSDNLVAMTTGLCSGMGNRKGACGVFTGGALALGLLFRQQGGMDGREIRKLTGAFQEALHRKAGAQICEDLLKKFGFFSNLNHRQCHNLTADAMEILAELIRTHDSQLGKPPSSP